MPTMLQQAIDIQWVVALASATTYQGWFAALAAAVTLSAANGNASVQIALVEQVVTSANGAIPAQVNMPPGSTAPRYYIVQLSSAGTVYPLATAIVSAYTLSTANGNLPVNVAKVIETCTAP
jgi:hypothetical protein